MNQEISEFLLSRNFDRYGKNETLVCLEDAEELSVKDGDLQMLMGDLSPQIYDDTMAMAQMRVKPGNDALRGELKNYASNYYATGDGELGSGGSYRLFERAERKFA